MFSFFSGPEIHPEAKTIAQYYQDLADAALSIRNNVTNTDNDAGFKQAADVLIQLADVCKDIETVSALEARDLNAQRSQLTKKMGIGGLINVQGEASKQLAIKYIELLDDVKLKKYWPSQDCPSLLGQSFLSKYGEGFEKRVTYINNDIQSLNARIDEYDRRLKIAI